jgi:imidazoleglycerol-phosphate dehydratase
MKNTINNKGGGIMETRGATVERSTKETTINLSLALEGEGAGNITTGIGFFDHMLHSFGVHGGFDLAVEAQGDIYVDCHHIIEDTGIVLGSAFAQAIGDKSGITRFGTFYVPMDEALVRSSLDFSGRPYLVFDNPIPQQMIGDFNSDMLTEFLRAFAFAAGITLHVHVLEGTNAHHIVEAVFKSLARALKEAVQITGSVIPSAKGVL